MSSAGASTRHDGSAADRHPECQGGDDARRVEDGMYRAPKGKGETANAQIAESMGVRWCGRRPCGQGTDTAGPPTSDSRRPWAGRRAACKAPRARRGSLPACLARGTGPARPAWRGHVDAARDTHPAQGMHGSKVGDGASEAKRWVSKRREHGGNAAGPARCDQPWGRFTVGGQSTGGAKSPIDRLAEDTASRSTTCRAACARRMPPTGLSGTSSQASCWCV